MICCPLFIFARSFTVCDLKDQSFTSLYKSNITALEFGHGWDPNSRSLTKRQIFNNCER